MHDIMRNFKGACNGPRSPEAWHEPCMHREFEGSGFGIRCCIHRVSGLDLIHGRPL